MNKQRGFTLIELLIVMAILAVLLALVLIAVNPVRQSQQANNAQRRNDLSAILNAVYQYAADRGSLPTGITTSLRLIGTSTSCDSLTCNGTTPTSICYDLASDVAPVYLGAVPYDPLNGNTSNTRYGIKKSATNNRITVTACDAELSTTIEFVR